MSWEGFDDLEGAEAAGCLVALSVPRPLLSPPGMVGKMALFLAQACVKRFADRILGGRLLFSLILTLQMWKQVQRGQRTCSGPHSKRPTESGPNLYPEQPHIPSTDEAWQGRSSRLQRMLRGRCFGVSELTSQSSLHRPVSPFLCVSHWGGRRGQGRRRGRACGRQRAAVAAPGDSPSPCQALAPGAAWGPPAAPPDNGGLCSRHTMGTLCGACSGDKRQQGRAAAERAHGGGSRGRRRRPYTAGLGGSLLAQVSPTVACHQPKQRSPTCPSRACGQAI